MNVCGKCNACCDIFPIPGASFPDGKDKSANTLCKYLKGGCSIQEEKPKVCAHFECLWLKLFKEGVLTTDEFSPTKVGAFFTVRYLRVGLNKGKFEVRVFETREGAVNEDHEFFHFIEEKYKNVRFLLKRFGVPSLDVIRNSVE